MREILLGGILLFWISNLFAQSPDTLWTKAYGERDGEYGRSVQETYDGGYIVAGYTASFGSGDYDIWLIKTDSNGDTLWIKRRGSTLDDCCYSVQQTPDSGYILAGYYTFRDTVWPYREHSDVCLIKTATNGSSFWTKFYGETSNDVGYSVQQTSDGGYIVAGYATLIHQSQSQPAYKQTDVYLIKTDPYGDTLWTKTYGGILDDCGYSVKQTSDGGYIVAGHISFPETLPPYTQKDLYLIKIDANGDSLWSKTYGYYLDDCGYSVQQTTDGGYIIVGSTFEYTPLYSNVYLLKTDVNGDTLWVKTYGDTLNSYGYSIQETTDGGYIIVGKIAGPGLIDDDVYLIKTDANGDTIWTSTYGLVGKDGGYSVQQTSDGGYIVAGYISSWGLGYDVYLIKTEPDIGIHERTTNKLADLKIPGLVYGNTLRLAGINRQTEVKVLDVLGRQLKNQNVTPEQPWIRLDNLTSGVYFLSITKEKPRLYKFVLIR